jgi:mRNA deadenylase 3'-5' endonuclease subunit Ccr4
MSRSCRFAASLRRAALSVYPGTRVLSNDTSILIRSNTDTSSNTAMSETAAGWTGRITVRLLGRGETDSDLDRTKYPQAQIDVLSLIPESEPLLQLRHMEQNVQKEDPQTKGIIENCNSVRLDVHVVPPLLGPTNKKEHITNNFTRVASENSANCLNRIGLSLAKRFNANTGSNCKRTGRGKHRTAPDYRAFTGIDDGQSSINTAELSNVEFWSKGLSQPLFLQLKIEGVNILLHTVVNPPTILRVSAYEKFESSIFPGVPIHVKVETLFASAVIVDWYADGTRVCQNSPVYVPTSNDATKELSVLITPVRPDHDGRGCQEAYRFKNRVERARPSNTVLEMRPYWQQPRDESQPALRILSFNILADQNAFSGPDRTCFFPWCPSRVVERSRRMPLIIHEILAYQADVICLQEVDEIVYDNLLDPVLRHYNYQGFYSVKQASGSQEGCAMFWSLNRFQPAGPKDMRTFRLGDLLAQYKSTLPGNSDWNACADVITGIFQKRPDLVDVVQNKLGHVLQVVHLQSLVVEDSAPMPLIVSNTHLFFHPNAPHIRLMQVFAIAHQLEEERTSSSQSKSHGAPFLLCGDFNSSLTNCGVLLMNRHVPKNHRDYRERFNTFRWEEIRGTRKQETEPRVEATDYDFPELNLPESFPTLATAYPTYPDFTHYVVGFSATLDHILMTTRTNRGGLCFLRQAEMPTREQVSKDVALPSPSFPSDHIAIVADLLWTTNVRELISDNPGG